MKPRPIIGPVSKLPVPKYSYKLSSDMLPKIGLAVESMKDHMTDEGWQIFLGLESAGYELFGHNIGQSKTCVRDIVRTVYPSTVVVQDKREWDVEKHNFRDAHAAFTDIQYLKERDDIFKVTILKDAHQRPQYHKNSADEMDCHAWIVYYNPKRVSQLATYVRPKHLIRTYHTVDRNIVPPYTADGRRGCILSGALSGAYPLRKRLWQSRHLLPEVETLRHPGYHRNGTVTPSYLELLSKFKVAICTASVYDYSVRKIIEATACGCMVLTNLSEEDKLPDIDQNLYRIPNGMNSISQIGNLIREMLDNYNPAKQQYFSEVTCSRYDYMTEGERLANAIEELRINYNA